MSRKIHVKLNGMSKLEKKNAKAEARGKRERGERADEMMMRNSRRAAGHTQGHREITNDCKGQRDKEERAKAPKMIAIFGVELVEFDSRKMGYGRVATGRHTN